MTKQQQFEQNQILASSLSTIAISKRCIQSVQAINSGKAKVPGKSSLTFVQRELEMALSKAEDTVALLRSALKNQFQEVTDVN